MKIKWRDRFLAVTQGNYARNCYSGGDEVVACPADMLNAGLWEVISRWGEGAWKTQELIKGNRSLPALAMSERQGGWGRSGYWNDLSPDQIETDITNYHLIGAPYFRKFNTEALHYYVGMLHQTDWALDRKNTWYDVLARGIPASTYAAGGIPLLISENPKVELITSFALEQNGRTSDWPSQGHKDEKTKGRWLHSDFKNVALPYVHRFFIYTIEQSR